MIMLKLGMLKLFYYKNRFLITITTGVHNFMQVKMPKTGVVI